MSSVQNYSVGKCVPGSLFLPREKFRFSFCLFVSALPPPISGNNITPWGTAGKICIRTVCENNVISLTFALIDWIEYLQFMLLLMSFPSGRSVYIRNTKMSLPKGCFLFLPFLIYFHFLTFLSFKQNSQLWVPVIGWWFWIRVLPPVRFYFSLSVRGGDVSRQTLE